MNSKILLVFMIMILVTGCSSKNLTESDTGIVSETIDSSSNSNDNSGALGKPGVITVYALSSHKYSSDCWIAYGSEVYDISAYVQKNSQTSLVEYCGTVGFENVLDSKNVDFADIQESSVYEGDLEQ